MKWVKQNNELMAWIIALFVPFFIDPRADSHFSICFFKWIGIDWCPGCGLGKSIAFLYRGEWRLSFSISLAGYRCHFSFSSPGVRLTPKEFLAN
jgi:hypothetical protein